MKTLYRPVGLKEWKLIEESGRTVFPPRLDWQPIFYPVLNFQYAAELARNWNTVDELSDFLGIVTRFEIDSDYVSQFEVQVVGAAHCEELWVPAEQLDEFNRRISGKISPCAAYYGERYTGPQIPVEAVPGEES